MEKSSFFNDIDDDRIYFAEDFAEFFNSLVTNGVFPNPSTNLQVIANNNMTVTIKAGKAWINGYVYINDSDLILPISVADGVLKRIDRLVIQFNTINRNITAKVKKGVFASSPVALALQRDADAYELGIADVYIANGATSISQANITDLRMNTAYCGWVNSLIQADTTAIFNQYQAWFTAQSNTYNTQMIANQAAFQASFEVWFATIQGQLDGDIAGNLSNAITALGGTGRTTETVKGNAAAIVTLDARVTSQSADNSKQVPHLGTTTNSGNNYSVTTTEVIATNQKFTVKINVATTSTATLNVSSIGSAKGIKRAGGSNATLKIGIYTFFYDGSNFQLLGEGGDYGTATADKVLTGNTIGTESGIVAGTIPNGVNQALPWTTNTNAPNFVIPDANYIGRTCWIVDTNLVPSVILSGKSVFGLAGTLISVNPLAGDSALIGEYSAHSTNSSNSNLVKMSSRYTVKYSGSIRIKFNQKNNTNDALAVFQIYKNGVPIGTPRSTFTQSYVLFSEDFNTNANDYFELWGSNYGISNIFEIGVSFIPTAQIIKT